MGRYGRDTKQQVTPERVARALVIGKSNTMTMALHLRFGDALYPKRDDEGGRCYHCRVAAATS